MRIKPLLFRYPPAGKIFISYQENPPLASSEPKAGFAFLRTAAYPAAALSFGKREKGVFRLLFSS
jgi:hypothetical protein